MRRDSSSSFFARPAPPVAMTTALLACAISTPAWTGQGMGTPRSAASASSQARPAADKAAKSGKSTRVKAPPAGSVASRLDRQAEAWVGRTLKKMTLDEKVGELVVPGLNGV